MGRSVLAGTLIDYQQSHKKPQTVIEPKVDLRPSALSIDTVNLCNLRCKHCFWDSYDNSIDSKINPRLLTHVRSCLKKYPTITNITWYGGEPLINEFSRKLVEEGIQLNKKNNLVITNGTNHIPYFGSNTHVGISLDGIESVNDDIRGKGVYKKARENVLSALYRHVPMAIIYCINSENIECMKEFVAEWYKTPINGVIFTYYTPLKNRTSSLVVSEKQKVKLVNILLELKDQYGKFIYNSYMMIELLKSKYNDELAANCPMNIENKNGKCNTIHMCNDGTIRKPCALGPDADHRQCRSITKMAIYAGLTLRDRESRETLFGLYHTKKHIIRHEERMKFLCL